MKNIVLFFAVVATALFGFSQTPCDGLFTDNGGIAGDYLPDTYNVTTICPNVPGLPLTVTFTSFDLEAQHDGLYVYDDTSVNLNNQFFSSNPAIPGLLDLPGAYWGNTLPGPFTSQSPSGCLTFVFKSDGAIQHSGWIANVSCAPITTGFELIPFLDANNNGSKDVGEFNFPQGVFQYQKNGGSTNYVYTPNAIGLIAENNPANIYDFNYTINPAYSAMYNVTTPSYTGVTVGATPGLVTLYFPITTTTYFTDLGVSIYNNYVEPKAGYNYWSRLIYTNYGNEFIANGSMSFTNDPSTTITSTSETVISTPTGFTYDFTNLSPFETRYIDVIMAVPSIPTVSLGQLLTNTISITTPATETTLTNNTSSVTGQIVASWDPNDITESHGEKIVFSSFDPNEYLTYTIRFENTGTAPADKVRVTNVLDALIDETSVQMIGSSNSYVMERVGNNLSWQFDNIQLPVSVANTTIGKGYITYKARLKSGFGIGTLVPNMAKIYFDTNPAIDTNTFNTEFVTNLSNSNFTVDHSISVFPNPATSTININLPTGRQVANSNIKTVELIDLQGRVLVSKVVNASQAILDIAGYDNGVYFIKVVGDSGIKIEKIIKE